jgi:hypothetical protein
MRLHSTSALTPQNQVHACNLNPIEAQCLFSEYKLKMQNNYDFLNTKHLMLIVNGGMQNKR